MVLATQSLFVSLHQKPFIVLTSGWAGAGLDITPQHNSGHSSGRTVFRIFYEIILIESAAVASRRDLGLEEKFC